MRSLPAPRVPHRPPLHDPRHTQPRRRRRPRPSGRYRSARPRMLTYGIFTTVNSAHGSILVVRLGALGDIVHALPAVASLKHNYPGSRLTWAVEPRWAPLLANNPFVDRLVFIRRDSL